jgi:hypothetical protein
MHQNRTGRSLGHPLVAQLGSHHRGRVLQHLQALPRMIFGFASVTRSPTRRFVFTFASLQFSRDAIFGILMRPPS